MEKVYKFMVHYDLDATIYMRAANKEKAKELYSQLPKPDIDVSNLSDSLIRTGYQEGIVVFPGWKISNDVKTFARMEKVTNKELHEFLNEQDKELAETLERRCKKGVSDK